MEHSFRKKALQRREELPGQKPAYQKAIMPSSKAQRYGIEAAEVKLGKPEWGEKKRGKEDAL